MHSLKHPVLLFILPATCSLAVACGSAADSEPGPTAGVVAPAAMQPLGPPPSPAGAAGNASPPPSGVPENSPTTPPVAAGFASQCAVSACYGAVVIDDFADEVGNAIAAGNATEGYWYIWPEAVGGPVLDDSVPNQIGASAIALPEFGGGIGVGFNSVSSTDCPADLSSFEGIRLTAQSLSGADEPMIASLPIPGTNQVPQGLCEEDCYNDHSVEIVIPAAGGTIDIAFAEVAQEASWGTKADFSSSEVQGIKLKKKEEGESFDIVITRVELYGDSGTECESDVSGASGGPAL